jgi:hypothetical protein
MDILRTWKDVFGRWPPDMPRRGILVVAFGEQIPFSGFSISDGFLLVERQTPDSMGARTVLVPYDQIAAVKIVDIVKTRLFQSLGFESPSGQR